MPSTLSRLGLTDLSVLDRLDLIEELWDSIPDSLEGVPVPDWHREIVQRGVEFADANPEALIPWEEVRAHLRRDR